MRNGEDAEAGLHPQQIVRLDVFSQSLMSIQFRHPLSVGRRKQYGIQWQEISSGQIWKR